VTRNTKADIIWPSEKGVRKPPVRPGGGVGRGEAGGIAAWLAAGFAALEYVLRHMIRWLDESWDPDPRLPDRCRSSPSPDPRPRRKRRA